jgi:hypothetical protein
MHANLLGIRILDFTGNDGKAVKGTQLFIAFQDKDVTGQATDKLFVRSDITLPKGLEVGKAIHVFFNRKGKVEAISIA